MVKLNLYPKVLAGVLVAGLCASSGFATEKDKEETVGKPAATTQVPHTSEDKVEPLGLESGKMVDKPADLADKIGDTINKFLVNEDK
ncbi:MAG: hypothetical protein ACOH2E_04535 [Candidatus Paracaedibacter sp.]